MKNALTFFFCFLLFSGISAQSSGPTQDECEDFNNGDVGNWEGYNAHFVEVKSTAPTADNTPYLRSKDGIGSSWIYNTVDFSGDLTSDTEDFCSLCFDYKIFNDGFNSRKWVKPWIRIFGGSHPESTDGFIAEFRFTTTLISEDSDWINLCIPLLQGEESLPQHPLGKWVMIEGSGVDDFNHLITNVTGIAFRLDVAASARPAEFIGIDNICYSCCSIKPKNTCQKRISGCLAADLVQWRLKDKQGNTKSTFCIDSDIILYGDVKTTTNLYKFSLSYKDENGDWQVVKTTEFYETPLPISMNITNLFRDLGVTFYKGVSYKLRFIIVDENCGWVENSQEFNFYEECCAAEDYLNFHFETRVGEKAEEFCLNEDVYINGSFPCAIDKYRLALAYYENNSWNYITFTDYIQGQPSHNITEIFEEMNVTLYPNVRYQVRLIVVLPTCGWNEINHEFMYRENNCCDGESVPINLRVEGNKLVWDPLHGATQYRIEFVRPNFSDPIPQHCVGCTTYVESPLQYVETTCWEVPEELTVGCFLWRVAAFCESTEEWTGYSAVQCSRSEDNNIERIGNTANENQKSGLLSGLSIYPNPSNGTVYLNLADWATKEIKLEIYDLKGKLISIENINTVGQSEVHIDLKEKLMNGTYLFKFIEVEQEVITKVIIQK